MDNWRGRSALLASLCVLGICLGCGGASKKGPTQKPTFKVTGEIRIDGDAPSPAVQIAFHPKSQTTEGLEVLPSCTSTEDGTFQLTTYKDGDGAPAGDYVVTVAWKEYDIMHRIYKEDKFKGKFDDPKTSKIEVTVGNKPVVMDLIDLKTK